MVCVLNNHYREQTRIMLLYNSLAARFTNIPVEIKPSATTELHNYYFSIPFSPNGYRHNFKTQYRFHLRHKQTIFDSKAQREPYSGFRYRIKFLLQTLLFQGPDYLLEGMSCMYGGVYLLEVIEHLDQTYFDEIWSCCSQSCVGLPVSARHKALILIIIVFPGYSIFHHYRSSFEVENNHLFYDLDQMTNKKVDQCHLFELSGIQKEKLFCDSLKTENIDIRIQSILNIRAIVNTYLFELGRQYGIFGEKIDKQFGFSARIRLMILTNEDISSQCIFGEIRFAKAFNNILKGKTNTTIPLNCEKYFSPIEAIIIHQRKCDLLAHIIWFLDIIPVDAMSFKEGNFQCEENGNVSFIMEVPQQLKFYFYLDEPDTSNWYFLLSIVKKPADLFKFYRISPNNSCHITGLYIEFGSRTQNESYLYKWTTDVGNGIWIKAYEYINILFTSDRHQMSVGCTLLKTVQLQLDISQYNSYEVSLKFRMNLNPINFESKFYKFR